MSVGSGLVRRLGIAFIVLAAPAIRLEAQRETYAVDAASSHVRIHLARAGLMKFLGHDHEIEAPIASGSVLVVDLDPARSSVELRFESARISVVPGSEPADDIPKVEERMRGPEVLDVARYPDVTFRSAAIRPQRTEGARLLVAVSGILTLRGRDFPVEIPLDVASDASGITAHGGWAPSLRSLGIEPPSVAGVVKVADRFRIDFEIRASATAKP